jgi:hypothetical protein
VALTATALTEPSKDIRRNRDIYCAANMDLTVNSTAEITAANPPSDLPSKLRSARAGLITAKATEVFQHQ